MASRSRIAAGIQTGDVLNDSFDVGRTIGSGTYSQVFEGTYLRKHRVALKVDRPGSRLEALAWEEKVLQQIQPFPFFARHYAFIPGSSPQIGDALQTNGRKLCNVLVMQQLGPNLSELRRQQPGEQLPLAAVLHIAERMLYCLEALHSVGYIHRDVKPSNFAVGLGTYSVPSLASSATGAPVAGTPRLSMPAAGTPAAREGLAGQLYCFDFGQARQYVFPGLHTVRPARETAEFRGTSLYSSLAAHALRDQGRRDDLVSWFYTFLDLSRGGLAWRVCKDHRRRCEALKKHYESHADELVADLPGSDVLLGMWTHIDSLSFEAKPDYAFLAASLRSVQKLVKAQGLEHARLRPVYRESEELHRVLAAVAEEERAAAGAGQAPPPDVGQLQTAAHLSPPPIRQLTDAQQSVLSSADTVLVSVFDCTRLRSSVDGVLHSRGGAWADNVYDGVTAQLTDLAASNAARSSAADATLIDLEPVLRVSEGGEPVQAARETMAALMAARRECESIITSTVSLHASNPAYMSLLHTSGAETAGGDEATGVDAHPLPRDSSEEWDENTAGIDRIAAALEQQKCREASSASGVGMMIAGLPAPAWLASHARALPYESVAVVTGANLVSAAQAALNDHYADRTLPYILLDATQRLRNLHNECLWAVAASLGVSASAAAVESEDGDGDEDGPTGGARKRARLTFPTELPEWRKAIAVQSAVVAYVSAWTAIAKLVLGKHAKSAKKDAAAALRSVTGTAAAKDGAEVPVDATQPLLTAFLKALVQAAKHTAGVDASSVHADASIMVATAREALRAVTHAAGAVGGGLAVELLAGPNVQLGINAQLLLAQAESLLRASGSSAAGATGAAGLPSLGATGAVDAEGRMQDAGADDGSVDSEDREVLEEAQRSLQVLDALMACIRKERELARAPPVLTSSEHSSPTVPKLTSMQAAAAARGAGASLPRSSPDSAAFLPALPALSSSAAASAYAKAATSQGASAGVPSAGARKSRWDQDSRPAASATAIGSAFAPAAPATSAAVVRARGAEPEEGEEEDMDMS